MTPNDPLSGDQLHPGQLVAGRYLVEAVIGRGGMAEVYRARDDRLARPVALKVLRAHYQEDELLRHRFEEEARAAAVISNPHVVAVYDAGEENSKAYIVMELVTGRTLSDLVARGPMDAAFVRLVGAQVLDALAAAHARGVLHRDIKPANILLTEDNEVKVADFGIAKVAQAAGEEAEPSTRDVVLGTPSYLAPERAQGHPATVRSDLFSVGVVLYEALVGHRPFAGDNAITIALAAQQGRYDRDALRRADIDATLEAVIVRSLDADPSRRFASATEMARALADPHFGETVVLAPVEASPTVRFAPATVVTPLAVSTAPPGRAHGRATDTFSAGRPSPQRSDRVIVASLVAAAVAAVVVTVLLLTLGSHHLTPTSTTRPATSTSTAPALSTTAPSSATTTSRPTSTTSASSTTTSSSSTTSTSTTEPSSTTTSSSSTTSTSTTEPSSTTTTAAP